MKTSWGCTGSSPLSQLTQVEFGLKITDHGCTLSRHLASKRFFLYLLSHSGSPWDLALGSETCHLILSSQGSVTSEVGEALAQVGASRWDVRTVLGASAAVWTPGWKRKGGLWKHTDLGFLPGDATACQVPSLFHTCVLICKMGARQHFFIRWLCMKKTDAKASARV